MKTLIANEFFKLRTVRGVWWLFAGAQALIVAGVAGLVLRGDDLRAAATPLSAVAHAGLVSLFSLILGMPVAGYVAPEDGCASYAAMVAGLAQLEADTHLHVHKENNILFPAVVALEAAGR